MFVRSFFALTEGGLAVASILMSSESMRAQDRLMAADLIVVNAMVRTMDSDQPVAEAVAVLGNRVAAIGTTTEIRQLTGKKISA